MKKRFPYLGDVLGVGVLLILILTNSNNFFPPLRDYVFAIWIVLLVFGIYTRIRYKLGKTNNQLRIPTNNDDYNRMVPFVFGTLSTVGGFFILKYMESDKSFGSILFTGGIFLFIIGFLYIPSGIIKIKNKELTIQNAADKKTIAIENIDSIELKADDIILTDKNEKKYYVIHLNLSESDFQKISDFLNQNLAEKIEIKTSI